MRRGQIFLCLMLVLLVPLGCTAAKKPDVQTQPKTIIVPEVSKISFQMVEFEKAPEIVQALAKNLNEKHFATWTAVNGTNYIVVSQDQLPAGNSVQISEIERRVPANDFDWVNVRLKYLSGVSSEQKNSTAKPLVASFTLDRTVKALGFEIAKEAAKAPAPVAPAPAAPKNTGAASTPVTEKGLKLDAPKAGDQIKSPLQISGSAGGVDGTVRVRLKGANGMTLVEKPLQPVGGNFNTTINFTSPVREEKGTVEAFVTGEDGLEKDNVSVPVTILPANTPETPGAP
ncbi:Gmad2 immunoglobulin-like domain-containing protein [Desulforamulus ruminis]|uniref:Spore germination protein-like Gmad2 n=1 Tax=Desulforamulus ruminis (strain ATCC 23193 / DSM 2154 / NCIMB 8452 / DL) TaxID=696281 RepID=F6DT78_DESRL|nr:Gmad2 immunoglobulin-like domain-containing protein [Desulforamulus ruminis]AEG61183.1 Spore germination protein-like Gmad2 [Desulforamulus ruminis DSM 2154]